MQWLLMVLSLTLGMILGGKYEKRSYCEWKYERHVDVDKCIINPDYENLKKELLE